MAVIEVLPVLVEQAQAKRNFMNFMQEFYETFSNAIFKTGYLAMF